jgi:hypothetical protein
MSEQACSSMVLVHVRKKNTLIFLAACIYEFSFCTQRCATKRVVQSILTTIRLQCRVVNSNFHKHTNEWLGHLSVLVTNRWNILWVTRQHLYMYYPLFLLVYWTLWASGTTTLPFTLAQRYLDTTPIPGTVYPVNSWWHLICMVPHHRRRRWRRVKK